MVIPGGFFVELRRFGATANLGAERRRRFRQRNGSDQRKQSSRVVPLHRVGTLPHHVFAPPLLGAGPPRVMGYLGPLLVNTEGASTCPHPFRWRSPADVGPRLSWGWALGSPGRQA